MDCKTIYAVKAEAAYALNNPMDVYPGSSPMSGKSFFMLYNRKAEIDAVKKSEDGVLAYDIGLHVRRRLCAV